MKDNPRFSAVGKKSPVWSAALAARRMRFCAFLRETKRILKLSPEEHELVIQLATLIEKNGA